MRKKQAKKLGITVEELEKREAEGGDLSEPEGIDISSEASSDPSRVLARRLPRESPSR